MTLTAVDRVWKRIKGIAAHAVDAGSPMSAHQARALVDEIIFEEHATAPEEAREFFVTELCAMANAQ